MVPFGRIRIYRANRLYTISFGIHKINTIFLECKCPGKPDANTAHMQEIFIYLLSWSEFWATLIPISVYLFHRSQPSYMRPVIIYLFIAMLINFTGNIISDYWRMLPAWMQSNTVLYNLHSMIRFVCFSLFFIRLNQHGATGLYKSLPLLSLLIFIFNFTLIDDFFNPDSLSGNLLAGEAYILLIYCMVYYLFTLRDDEKIITQEPDFWVVTGLALYVVVNFFVFLFYGPMLNHDVQLAMDIWDVHNYAYITLCLFIAKALYDAPRYQYSI